MYLCRVHYIIKVFNRFDKIRVIDIVLKSKYVSFVAGLVVRHGDLSHKMTLSHEGRRTVCDNVNRV